MPDVEPGSRRWHNGPVPFRRSGRFDAVNQGLLQVEQQLRRRNTLHQRLRATEDELRAQRARLEELRQNLEREQRDVEQLEAGLGAMFQRLLGTHEARLQQEQQEALVARVEYAACRDGVLALQGQVAQLRAEIDSFRGLRQRQRELLARKEALIASGADRQFSQRMERLDRRLCAARDELREIDEAVHEGRQARALLRRVDQLLERVAHSLSWLAAGGSGGSSRVARMDLLSFDRARRRASEAQVALGCFQRELADLRVQFDVPCVGVAEIETHGGGRLSLDLVELPRRRAVVEESQRAMVRTARAVEELLRQLDGRRRGTESRERRLALQRAELLHAAS